MNLLKSLLSDSTGAISTQRVAFLVVVVGVIGKNVLMSWKLGASLDFTPWEMGIIAAAFGGKAIQSFAENGHGKQPPA